MAKIYIGQTIISDDNGLKDDILGGASDAFDTLKEIQTSLDNDQTLSVNLTNAIAEKAPKADPTFTGNVLLDNDTNNNKTFIKEKSYGINGAFQLQRGDSANENLAVFWEGAASENLVIRQYLGESAGNAVAQGQIKFLGDTPNGSNTLRLDAKNVDIGFSNTVLTKIFSDTNIGSNKKLIFTDTRLASHGLQFYHTGVRPNTSGEAGRDAIQMGMYGSSGDSNIGEFKITHKVGSASNTDVLSVAPAGASVTIHKPTQFTNGISGDLSVDTNILKVDATLNKVGIKHTPVAGSNTLHVNGGLTVEEGGEKGLFIQPGNYQYKIGDIDGGDVGTNLAINASGGTFVFNAGNVGINKTPASGIELDVNGHITGVDITVQSAFHAEGDALFDGSIEIADSMEFSGGGDLEFTSGGTITGSCDIDVTGSVTTTGNAIAAEPTASTHLATKNYVDGGEFNFNVYQQDGSSSANTAAVVDIGNQHIPSIDIEYAYIGAYTGILPAQLFKNKTYYDFYLTLNRAVTGFGDQCFAQGSTQETHITPQITTLGNEVYKDNVYISGTVDIPNTITQMGTGVFSGTNLSGYTIGTGITTIPDSTFKNCSSLNTINFPSHITAIGAEAFSGCTGATGTSANTITIPDNIITIGQEAFKSSFGSNGLTTVSIGDGVTTIGDEAFSGSVGSITSLSIGSSVTTVGTDAFANINSLTSLTIPNNVTSIGVNAFGTAYNMGTVTFASGGTSLSIGTNAFQDYYDATVIDLPSHVSFLDDGAFNANGISFSGGTPLIVRLRATTPPSLGTNGTPFSNSNASDIEVPTTALSAYGGVGATFAGLNVVDGGF